MPYRSGVAGRLGPGGAAGGPYVSPVPGAGANGRAPMNINVMGDVYPTGIQGNRMANAGLLGGLRRWGGRFFTGLNVLETVNNIRKGEGGWGALGLGITAPKASVLTVLDQRPAGGALYDEDGNLLEPELTPAQKALKERLRKQGAESGAFRYTDGNSSSETTEAATVTTTNTDTDTITDTDGPKVVNLGGVSYNVNSPEGLKGARKALESGAVESIPQITDPAARDHFVQFQSDLTPEQAVETSSTSPAEALETSSASPADKQSDSVLSETAGMNQEDKQMFQWARNFRGLAEKVKPGQAGYAVIQQALGKAPTKIEDVDFSSEDAAAFGMPQSERGIRRSGGFTEWNTDMDVDAPGKVEKSAQDFLKDRINSGFYAASSEQQPNFDGSNDTIGEDSKPIPLEVQDFDNATKNPNEVVGDLKGPLGDDISSAPNPSNAGELAYQFRFNPVKNLFA